MIFHTYIPGRPCPWQRRVQTKTRHTYNPPVYENWREAARLYMRAAMTEAGLAMTTDCLHLDLLVCLPDRKHGDIDNYEKAVNDTAEGVIFENDKQVVSARKLMVLCPDAPGMHIVYRSAGLRAVEDREVREMLEEWSECTLLIF